jgi:hypothetical protein
MRILFDQESTVPIRPFLSGHEVRTAFQEGWDRLRNGDLLHAAENAGFDSADHRQEHALSARRIKPPDRDHRSGQATMAGASANISRVIEAVDAAKPGAYEEVEIP